MRKILLSGFILLVCVPFVFGAEGDTLFFDDAEGSVGTLWTGLQDGQAISYVSSTPTPYNGSDSGKWGDQATFRGSYATENLSSFTSGNRTVEFYFYDGGGFSSGGECIQISVANSISFYLVEIDDIGINTQCSNTNSGSWQLYTSTDGQEAITTRTTGSWLPVRMVVDNDHGKAYVSVNNGANTTGTFTAGTNMPYLKLGHNSGGSGYWAFDDLRVCEGSYCEYPVEPNTITLNVNNILNGTGINTFCVDYTGNGTGTNCTESGTLTFSQITGTLTFDFYNMTEYFNTTITTEIGGAANIQANTTQGYALIEAYELFTNNQITGFNATNNQITNATTTTTLLLPVNTGVNTLSVSVEGNYTNTVSCTGISLDTASCNATGIYDNLFKINATDALSGNAITGFNVTSTNITLGSDTFETTNGTYNVPLLQSYSWNFFIDAPGYAHANVTLEANASTNEYEFSLLPTNSIFLYFFDEDTLASITQNVTVEFTDGITTFSNTTSTGEMIASELSPATWELTVSSAGYETRNYFVTVVARSAQDIDVYLLNETTAETTTFTVKDSNDGDVISGATMTMQHNVGGSWVSIDQQETDAFGIAVFDLENNKQYRFIIEASGYSTKTGEFTRTTGAYIVTITDTNTQSFTTYLDDFTYVTAPILVNVGVTNFSITTSSPEGKLEWFSVSVVLNGTTTTNNVTGSPSGGTALVSLNLSTFAGEYVLAVYRVKSTSFDDPLVVSNNWYIKELASGNYTFTDFMEHYEDEDNGLSFASKGIILTIVAVLLAIAVGAFLGVEAAAVVAAIVYVTGGYYGWVHWSVIIVVVTALIGLLFSRGRRI